VYCSHLSRYRGRSFFQSYLTFTHINLSYHNLENLSLLTSTTSCQSSAQPLAHLIHSISNTRQPSRTSKSCHLQKRYSPSRLTPSEIMIAESPTAGLYQPSKRDSITRATRILVFLFLPWHSKPRGFSSFYTKLAQQVTFGSEH
jgi:hypothetical protein